MKKGSLIVSLALLLGLPFGLGAAAGSARATCYVPGADGGYEVAGSFQDRESCETMAGGYWY